MSHTPCDRSDGLVPMRWRHAGGDLARPDDLDQRADRPLTRSAVLSKCPGRPLCLPCVRVPWRRSIRIAHAIMPAAKVKSP
jgi:hypothetical protein